MERTQLTLAFTSCDATRTACGIWFKFGQVRVTSATTTQQRKLAVACTNSICLAAPGSCPAAGATAPSISPSSAATSPSSGLSGIAMGSAGVGGVTPAMSDRYRWKANSCGGRVELSPHLQTSHGKVEQPACYDLP